MSNERAEEAPVGVPLPKSASLGSDVKPEIREFRGLEATFLGRVVWLGAVGVAWGAGLALLASAVAYVHNPNPDRFLGYLAFPDDLFAGASYWGWPFPYLRIACPVHSDGAWDFAWSLFVLDALIWALPIVFIASVVLSNWKVTRMERWRRGVCLRCAYDLRGLSEPRCPECGAAFEHVLVHRTDGAPD